MRMAKGAATFSTVLIIFLVVFLMVYNLYETDRISALKSADIPLWLHCNRPNKSVACDQTEEAVGKNKTTAFIPNRAYYAELQKKRRGVRAGSRMEIAVLSAFEYPEQVNVMITSEGKYGDDIYCRYFDNTMKEIGQPFQSVVFPEFTIHCLRREGAKFITVSNEAKGDYEYPVPIIDRTQDEPPHFFGVCIAPFYGTEPKWLQIAEFIEHYKIQGATYFYAYTAYIDEYSRIILDDYVRTGDVDNVVLHDRMGRTHNRWHTMEIQECLNRARGHSRWVAFVDLDERLTPTEFNGTLIDYLKSITDEEIGSIEFRQRWILKNESLPEKYTDSKQVDEWMPTRRWHNTSHVGPVGHTVKCIIDPKKVLIMDIHRVTSFYNFDEYRTYGLKPEEGVVRHYRDLASGDWGKNWLKSVAKMGEFSMTSYPEKWMEQLQANVKRRVHHVYGPVIPKPKLS